MTDTNLDLLLHRVGLIADTAASDKYREGAPSAQVTQAGVYAAFRAAVTLGMITITDPATWPHLTPLTGWSETHRTGSWCEP